MYNAAIRSISSGASMLPPYPGVKYQKHSFRMKLRIVSPSANGADLYAILSMMPRINLVYSSERPVIPLQTCCSRFRFDIAHAHGVCYPNFTTSRCSLGCPVGQRLVRPTTPRPHSSNNKKTTKLKYFLLIRYYSQARGCPGLPASRCRRRRARQPPPPPTTKLK